MTDEIIKDDVAVSPRFSFKGYDIGIWWSKNKDGIKWSLSVCVFLFVFIKILLDTSPFTVEAMLGLSLAAGLAMKKALDALDFGVSEVKLS